MQRFSLLLFSILLTLFTASSLSQTVVETSHQSHEYKITGGSSISASSSPNKTNFWLSPSGYFAFGFYPLQDNSHQYIVGIWEWDNDFSYRTLLWTLENIDHYYQPLNEGSSTILFNHNGVFALQMDYDDGFEEQPLFLDVFQPAAYAMLLDTGKLALYNSNDQVIWYHDRYGSDTMVMGQTLNLRQCLTSKVYRSDDDSAIGLYKLRIPYNDGKLVLENWYIKNGDLNSLISKTVWESGTTKKNNTWVSMKLDMFGRIYFVDSDGSVIKNLTEGDQEQKELHASDDRSVVYRATVGSDGIFRLYKDRNGNGIHESEIVWDTTVGRNKNSNRKKILVERLSILHLVLNCGLVISFFEGDFELFSLFLFIILKSLTIV